MTFDPKRVERRTTVSDADGNITLIAAIGFNRKPTDDLPFGCPPEFRRMIEAARNGDTSLIAISFYDHPERRHENVPVETRSLQHRKPQSRFAPRATVRSKVSGHSTVLKVFAMKDENVVMHRRKALLKSLLD
jgi:hypothetical protein